MKKIKWVVTLGDSGCFIEKEHEWILYVYKGHLPWEKGTSDQPSLKNGRKEERKLGTGSVYLSVYLAWTHLRQKVVVYCIV